MDLRSFVTTQDQKDCKKCKKYLRGEKIKKTQSIVPAEIGRKYCKSCKSNYCTKIPNSEVCKSLLPMIEQEELNEMIEKTRIQAPKLKVPADERCVICRKHVIALKKSKDNNQKYILDEDNTIEIGQSCMQCKKACKEIELELEGDVKFCSFVDELLLYYIEYLHKRKANK
jgi:hypothetical protein